MKSSFFLSILNSLELRNRIVFDEKQNLWSCLTVLQGSHPNTLLSSLIGRVTKGKGSFCVSFSLAYFDLVLFIWTVLKDLDVYFVIINQNIKERIVASQKYFDRDHTLYIFIYLKNYWISTFWWTALIKNPKFWIWSIGICSIWWYNINKQHIRKIYV